MKSEQIYNKKLSCFFDSKIFWGILIIILASAYGSAFIAGFRMPSTWTFNYYIPSFFDGLLKRGLIGSFFYFLGDIRFNYYFITAFEITVFLLLNILVIKNIATDKFLVIIFSAFLFSPLGPYLFDDIGYSEQLLFIFLVLALYLNSIVLGTVMMICAIYTHEIAIVTVIPLFYAYKFYKKTSLPLLIISALIIILNIIIYYWFFHVYEQVTIQAFKDVILAKANFGVRYDYFDLVYNPPIARHYNLAQYYKNSHLVFIGILSPLYILSGYLFYKTNRRIMDFFAGLIPPVLPLLAGGVAWDIERWLFLSACALIVCFYAARKSLSWFSVTLIVGVMISLSFFAELNFFTQRMPRALTTEGIYEFFQNGLWVEITKPPGL